MKRRAIFLDRDGTINPDPGYISSPDLITELLPHVGEGLKVLKKLGFQLIVTTNQSGVNRGKVKAEDLPAINSKINSILKSEGVQIDHFEMCFHRPDEGCACRKPEPGMLMNAAKQFSLSLEDSYMIGDRSTDLEVGRRAGCKGVILVRTGDGPITEKNLFPGQCDFIADDLLEAAKWVEKHI